MTGKGSKRGIVKDKYTISNGAGLGFVKPDHLGSFGANLNLFVELQTQENAI